MKVKVFRYNPLKDKKPRYENYKIKTNKSGMRVLGALYYINETYNANIAFRSSCRSNQCGSCAMMINSKPGLACKTFVKDNMVIEPLKGFPVIRDLVVSIKHMHEKTSRLRPFLHRGNTEYKGIEKISAKAIAEFKPLKECIDCFACIASCPSVENTKLYAGPTFMRLIARFALDPRDTLKRTPIAIEEGVYRCTTCGMCGAVCPKEINIHEGAVERLRELIFKEYMLSKRER